MKVIVCLLVLGATAHAGPRFRLAGISIGAGYTYFDGRYWGAPWLPGYGYYPAGFYPGWFGGFAHPPGYGEVKLKSESRDAEVFLDGAFCRNRARPEDHLAAARRVQPGGAVARTSSVRAANLRPQRQDAAA